MITAFIAAIAIGMSPQDSQSALDKAWAYEQAQRNLAGKVLNDDEATEAEVRQTLKDLEKLILYCQRPDIKDLKTSDGTAMLYYQINDILVQMIGGYARLKDLDTTIKLTERLSQNLTAPDSWVKGDKRWMFTNYADTILNDEDVAKFLPNVKLEAVVANLRRNDPDYIFSTVPYSVADSADISTSDRIAGLSMIWSEAKYNFANFRLVPILDWDAAYQKYLPLVIAANSKYEYYNYLREFIGYLKDSHTDVALPASLSAKMEVRPSLPVVRVENSVVIWLEPSEAFQKLGFHRGDVIRKIDGVDAIEYGRKTWAHRISSSTPQDADMRMYSYMLLCGPVDSPVKLEVEHTDGSVNTVSVDRNAKLPGVSLPTSDFKILPDGTAYFAFNTCRNDAPAEAFTKALPEIQKAGRLIIDCRMNDGGNGGVGYTILSHLIDKSVDATKWETNTYRPSFRAWHRASDPYGGTSTVAPGKTRFDGPVVVLCGPRTFSAGEDFLAAYKMSKRGKLIGMPTGGSTGQPLSFKLPGGGWARVCSKRDRMADGTEFVGKGVQPDVKLWTTVEALRKNQDPVLEEAVRQVNKK